MKRHDAHGEWVKATPDQIAARDPDLGPPRCALDHARRFGPCVGKPIPIVSVKSTHTAWRGTALCVRHLPAIVEAKTHV